MKDYDRQKLIDTITPIIMEACMISLSEQAKALAPMCTQMNGQQALEKFANSVVNANNRIWPKEGMVG